jgi:hypothetical protein
MASPFREPTGPFQIWLLRHVAQAVLAGEVPAALPTDLWAGFEAT